MAGTSTGQIFHLRNMKTKLLTVAAWAKKNGITRQRAYIYITAGRLKFKRVNVKEIRIDESEPMPEEMPSGAPRKLKMGCDL